MMKNEDCLFDDGVNRRRDNEDCWERHVSFVVESETGAWALEPRSYLISVYILVDELVSGHHGAANGET